MRNCLMLVLEDEYDDFAAMLFTKIQEELAVEDIDLKVEAARSYDEFRALVDRLDADSNSSKAIVMVFDQLIIDDNNIQSRSTDGFVQEMQNRFPIARRILFSAYPMPDGLIAIDSNELEMFKKTTLHACVEKKTRNKNVLNIKNEVLKCFELFDLLKFD